MAIAKEQIRQIIADKNFTNVADVYAYLKEGFKDLLQELMETEMDAALGYKKNRKVILFPSNKRNGYSTKTLKSQYGEFPIAISRDRNGEFEPKLIPKYQRDISGILSATKKKPFLSDMNRVKDEFGSGIPSYKYDIINR